MFYESLTRTPLVALTLLCGYCGVSIPSEGPNTTPPAESDTCFVGKPQSFKPEALVTATRKGELNCVVLERCAIDELALEALLKEDSVRVLDVGYTNIAPERLARGAFFRRLRFLTVSGLDITTDFLDSLDGCQNLEGLWLGCTKIDDSSLCHLQSLPKLSALSLRNTNVSDKSIRVLRKMQLTYLDVRGTRVTPRGAFHMSIALPDCRIVTTSYMGGGPDEYMFTSSPEHITSEDFVAEAKRLRLLSVDVSDLSLDEEAIRALHAEATILDLDISRTNVDPEVLVDAPFFERLARLKLKGLNLSKEFLESLGRCTRLRHLDLASTNIDDTLLPHLATIGARGQLKTLVLRNTSISDKSIPVLGEMRQLRLLVVNSTKISPAGLSLLRKKLPDCFVDDSI